MHYLNFYIWKLTIIKHIIPKIRKYHRQESHLYPLNLVNLPNKFSKISNQAYRVKLSFVDCSNTCNIKVKQYIKEDYVGIMQVTTIIRKLLFIATTCPCRDFAQKAKSREGTLVTRGYIKESTYSWNIQSYSQ